MTAYPTLFTTVVSTSTATVAATSTTTVYAACATGNILGPRLASGQYVSGVSIYEQYAASNATNAYDCCVACINSPNCDGAGFSPSHGGCILLPSNAGTCVSPQENGGAVNYGSAVSDISVSNGLCGYFSS